MADERVVFYVIALEREIARCREDMNDATKLGRVELARQIQYEFDAYARALEVFRILFGPDLESLAN